LNELSDRRRLFHTFFFPSFFLIVLWIIKVSEVVFHFDLSGLGVFPRQLKGIPGILFAPLIHGDFNHLFSNSIPLFILGSGLFYFYRAVAYPVFGWIYFMSGIWVWVSARPAYHIGASGVVYGLASFLFFSGLIRKNNYLMAFSMLVVFLYGSMFWGILPLDLHISWESHLLGGVAGLFCALYFRKMGPQREVFDWEKDAGEPIDADIPEETDPLEENKEI
jgi:membrane associated rhomboid family serine protease